MSEPYNTHPFLGRGKAPLTWVTSEEVVLVCRAWNAIMFANPLSASSSQGLSESFVPHVFKILNQIFVEELVPQKHMIVSIFQSFFVSVFHGFFAVGFFSQSKLVRDNKNFVRIFERIINT